MRLSPLERDFSQVDRAVAEAAAAPLSRKKAMLAALLIDRAADDLLADGGDDVLEMRAGLAAASDALGLVFDLCAMRAGGPELVVETVAVPLAEHPALRVEDYMVSLYNGNTVQRVRIAVGDARRDVHEVLAAALAALKAL